MKFAASFFTEDSAMTKEELKELIARLQSEKRENHIEPTYVDFNNISVEVSSLAIAEMKKNLRTLYEAGEIKTHRTLNGISISTTDCSD